MPCTTILDIAPSEQAQWFYKLSRAYEEPEVTAAVERIATGQQAKVAA